jgi:hypothetical protein
VSAGEGLESCAIRAIGLSVDGGSAGDKGRSTCGGSVPQAANTHSAEIARRMRTPNIVHPDPASINHNERSLAIQAINRT